MFLKVEEMLMAREYFSSTLYFSSRFLLGRRQPGLHQAVAKVDLVKVNLGTQQVKQVNTTETGVEVKRQEK